ncbi:MAG: N-acetylmuramoyl-L-alanine amidase [Lachnospiraceae bacterium]|nr:N-acetylmuramoyl-L-alanine amidase [Lachnospiraceae bacterium]
MMLTGILLLAFLLGGCNAFSEIRGPESDHTQEIQADHTEENGEHSDFETSSETPEESDVTEAVEETGAAAPTEEIPIESCDEDMETPGMMEPEYRYIEANDMVYAWVRLNVRTSESTQSDILGVLEVGEAVNRTGIHEEWTRVVYQGQTAFVATEYISEIKPEPETAESTAAAVASEGTGIYYDNGGYLVAIDPGHQGKGNSDKEPVGPGASEMKAKVSSGTQGVVTGIPEHEMNLVISLYLRDELLARGYSVLMIRETADVDISNAERAELANSCNSDIFVRIHGNSVSNQEIHGALTMCMTQNNPYNGNLYMPSKTLSQLVVDYLCAATGAVNKGILETDTMSGINWCKIPVTIVEVGFMSNPKEDQAMAEDDYRRAMAKGIADGIDAYFGR